MRHAALGPPQPGAERDEPRADARLGGLGHPGPTITRDLGRCAGGRALRRRARREPRADRGARRSRVGSSRRGDLRDRHRAQRARRHRRCKPRPSLEPVRCSDWSSKVGTTHKRICVAPSAAPPVASVLMKRAVVLIVVIAPHAATTCPSRSSTRRATRTRRGRRSQPPGARVRQQHSRTSSGSTTRTRATTSSSCSSPAARAGTTTAAPARTASAAPRTPTACPTITTSSRRSSRRSSTATTMTSPSTDWNYVYVPYCTGDVHTGNAVATYTDEHRHRRDHVPPRRPRRRREGRVVDRHELHARAEDARDRLLGRRRRLDRQLPLPAQGRARGRAGATCSTTRARSSRRAATRDRCTRRSARRGTSTRSPDLMPPEFTFDDMGTLNIALADEFPHDRLATTFFQRDDDFSVYSYERFYNIPDKDQIMQMWAVDTAAGHEPLPDAQEPLLLPAVLAKHQQQPLHDRAHVRGLRHRGSQHDARAVGRATSSTTIRSRAWRKRRFPAKIREPMRWLVTGGAGFLGINLVRHLLARGDAVTSLDREPFDVSRARSHHRGPRRHPRPRRRRARGRGLRRRRARGRGAAAVPAATRSTRSTSTARAPCSQRRGRAAGRPRVVDRGVRRAGSSPAGRDRSRCTASGRTASRRSRPRRVCDEARAARPGRRDPAAEVVRRPRAARRVRDAVRVGARGPRLPDPRPRRQPLPAARRRGPVRRRSCSPARCRPTRANDTFNIGAAEFTTLREDFQAVLDDAGHGRTHPLAAGRARRSRSLRAARAR